MNDHCQRIRKQLLTEAENRAIEEMETRAEPLIIVVVVCLVAVLASSLIDAYATHKHADQIQAASAFASCLNGQQIEVGDSWASCSINKITLVEGIK